MSGSGIYKIKSDITSYVLTVSAKSAQIPIFFSRKLKFVGVLS